MTKGHQFRTYRKPDPGVQAVKASMAFQAPPPDHAMGNLDLGLVDTTPGKRGSMSPPAGTDLTAAQYQDLMRKRYRDDPGYRQHMVLYAKRKATCSGPYAEQAAAILSAIRGDK